MRALTLHVEWAWAVMFLPDENRKDIENRGKPIPEDFLGQWIGLHGGCAMSSGDGTRGIPVPKDDRFTAKHYAAVKEMLYVARTSGASVPHSFLALSDDAKCHRIVKQASGLAGFVRIGGQRQPRAERERWHMPGQYGYELADRQALAAPVPCKGMLGFWTIPRDVVGNVASQLPAGAPRPLIEALRRSFITG